MKSNCKGRQETSEEIFKRDSSFLRCTAALLGSSSQIFFKAMWSVLLQDPAVQEKLNCLTLGLHDREDKGNTAF
jgi:hypothetical protein